MKVTLLVVYLGSTEHQMMYSRSEQLDIIKDINIKEGDSLTLDCPFCNGRKKFTISYLDGKVLWNCYRASCNVRGIYSKGYSLKSIKNKLNSENLPCKYTSIIRPMPTYLSRVEVNSKAIEYLKEVNSWLAYEKNYIDIKYSPIDNRVIFLHNSLLGAIGRTLIKEMPKWITYGTAPSLYKVGKGNTAILVEDVPSACAISNISKYTGVALCGTNISADHCLELNAFDDAIVVLDNDASKKAIKLSKKINSFLPCTVRFTKEDLKYLSPKQIDEVLYDSSL